MNRGNSQGARWTLTETLRQKVYGELCRTQRSKGENRDPFRERDSIFPDDGLRTSCRYDERRSRVIAIYPKRSFSPIFVGNFYSLRFVYFFQFLYLYFLPIYAYICSNFMFICLFVSILYFVFLPILYLYISSNFACIFLLILYLYLFQFCIYISSNFIFIYFFQLCIYISSNF